MVAEVVVVAVADSIAAVIKVVIVAVVTRYVVTTVKVCRDRES